MAKKYGALVLIGLGAGLLLMSSGGKAHAKALPPSEDDEDEDTTEDDGGAPQLPDPEMPPPQAPVDPGNVVVEAKNSPPEEVPVGDVLMGEISYQEPGKPPVTSSPDEVLPVEEDDDDDDDTPPPAAADEDDEDDDEILQPEVVAADQPLPPAPPAPAPAPVPVVPSPAPVAPPPAPATPPPMTQAPTGAQPNNPEQKSVIPSDTAALLRIMLADETRANWKRRVPELGPWQRARGLKDDEAFGTVSALRMAQETGLIPIIRFWPAGSYPEGHWLTDYRKALRSLSMSMPEPHASQLVAAANRETGQGFGRGQTPISPAIQI
jgi:hypothetical protein